MNKNNAFKQPYHFSDHTPCQNYGSYDKHMLVVSWQKPPMEWVKLNTNRSSLGNQGQAGCGGLLRNEFEE